MRKIRGGGEDEYNIGDKVERKYYNVRMGKNYTGTIYTIDSINMEADGVTIANYYLISDDKKHNTFETPENLVDKYTKL